MNKFLRSIFHMALGFVICYFNGPLLAFVAACLSWTFAAWLVIILLTLCALYLKGVNQSLLWDIEGFKEKTEQYRVNLNNKLDYITHVTTQRDNMTSEVFTQIKAKDILKSERDELMMQTQAQDKLIDALRKTATEQAGEITRLYDIIRAFQADYILYKLNEPPAKKKNERVKGRR